MMNSLRPAAIIFLAYLAGVNASHYSTLGIPINADESEIKRAYRAAAKASHPDKPTGDIEKFQEVSTAYETLSDPVSKRRYDQENLRRQSHPHRHHRYGGEPMPPTSGKTFLFRQGGQTFMFTEDDLFGRQHQQYQQSHPQPQSSMLEDLWSLGGHLVVFGLIFYALREVLSSEQGDQPTDRQNRSGGSANTQSKPERGLSAVEMLAAAQAPHVAKFQPSFLRHRARRCCVFFPRHCDSDSTWNTLEHISLAFIHDRLDFSWVDLASEPEWQTFLACEYPDQAQPLAVVFGSAGAKASRFPASSQIDIDLSTPLTPMSPVKDQLRRWVERIIEGMEDLPKVVNEPPKHRQ
jgi:curved DNA-binding protein CbpA